MIRKVKGGYAVKHCHGKRKGKTIAKHKTKKEALAQHRAIKISKLKARSAAALRQYQRHKRKKK